MKHRIMKYSLIGVIVFSMIIFGTIVANALLSSPQIAGSSIFPTNNIWNTSIDKLPLDKNSSKYINSIGSLKGLHPDYGSREWDGQPIGISKSDEKVWNNPSRQWKQLVYIRRSGRNMEQ